MLPAIKLLYCPMIKFIDLYLHVQLARRCEQVLIEKYLDVFYTEFLLLLNNDRNEGMCSVHFYTVYKSFAVDLGRMYSLVSRVPAGMAELRKKFEIHVHSQGLSAIEKCGDTIMNVCIIVLCKFFSSFLSYSI